MKRFLILTLSYVAIGGAIMFGLSFNSGCKHIYVAVEEDKVEYTCSITPHPMLPRNIDWALPKVGSHNSDHDEKNMAEGISLVCVKCFHQTRQKIHYKHK